MTLRETMIPESHAKLNPRCGAKLRVVRLTPQGRGGVATILLHGPNAVEAFSRHWNGPVPVGNETQVFGSFLLDGDGLHEKTVVYAPDSETVEIHCHGGEAVVEAIESVLVSEGAEPIAWQDYFCPGRTQREQALRLLPFAPTERTAQILLDQYNGALERELAEIDSLSEPEEKRRRRDRLTENARLARHLVQPFRVVLAGPVNAGKSSLLNAVLGFRRAIVDPTPGTTRDAVSSRTALDGFPVEFIDTAGFRNTDHELERQGIQRSEQSLAGADLVLWVVDVTTFEPSAVPDRPDQLLCLNKIDLLDQRDILRRLDGIPVSAVDGEGLDCLLRRVVDRLVPNPPAPLEAVPLTDS